MARLSTKQVAVMLHSKPQTFRRDRCREKPQIPFIKTPTGRIYYEKDVVIDWLAHRLNRGVSK